jgi:hypothetical protein
VEIRPAPRPCSIDDVGEIVRGFAETHLKVSGALVSHVTLHVHGAGDTRLPLPPTTDQAGAPRPRAFDPVFGEPWKATDYSVVTWQGRKWEFGHTAKLVVKALWEAWQAGQPLLSQEDLLTKCGTSMTKLSDVLRPSKSLGSLIVRVGTWYKLAFAEEGEATGGEDNS